MSNFCVLILCLSETFSFVYTQMGALEAMQDQSAQIEVSMVLLGNHQAINDVFGDPPEYAAVNSIDALAAAQIEVESSDDDSDTATTVTQAPKSVERSVRLATYPKSPKANAASADMRSDSPPRMQGGLTQGGVPDASGDYNAAGVSKAQAMLAAIPDKVDQEEILKTLPSLPPMELPGRIDPADAFAACVSHDVNFASFVVSQIPMSYKPFLTSDVVGVIFFTVTNGILAIC